MPRLEMADEIKDDRLRSWNYYYELLMPLAGSGCLELPVVTAGCEHNGSIFYIKVKDKEERSKIIRYLSENGVRSAFHYIPLHSSTAGTRYGCFHGEDRYTTTESERLLRLPLYYGLAADDIEYTAGLLKRYYR